jgi:DNA-binding LytR/AlgR family response regulator
LENPASTLTCLIVDDDTASRLVLQRYLEQEGDLVLLDSVDSGEKALDFIGQNPDLQLLFLDIQMPGLSGMDVLHQIPSGHGVKAILTTGEREFAVEAFELEAFDYLVKPISQERFKASVERARKAIANENRTTDGPKNKEFFFKTSNKFVRVRTDEILFVEALSDYVVLVMEQGPKHIVHSTMKAMEEKLIPFGFMRIHRSYIANLEKVQAVADHHATLGGKKVPISKSYQDEFYDKIKSQRG